MSRLLSFIVLHRGKVVTRQRSCAEALHAREALAFAGEAAEVARIIPIDVAPTVAARVAEASPDERRLLCMLSTIAEACCQLADAIVARDLDLSLVPRVHLACVESMIERSPGVTREAVVCRALRHYFETVRNVDLAEVLSTRELRDILALDARIEFGEGGAL